MTIDELSAMLDLKKRTINFWVKEYGLDSYIKHSNAGNTYSEECIKLLRIIDILKKKEWFSAAAIILFIENCKKLISEKNDTRIIPAEFFSLETAIQEILFDTVLPQSHSQGSAVPEITDNFLRGEFYREKQKDFQKALHYYEIAAKENNEFKELAILYIDILKDLTEQM